MSTYRVSTSNQATYQLWTTHLALNSGLVASTRCTPLAPQHATLNTKSFCAVDHRHETTTTNRRGRCTWTIFWWHRRRVGIQLRRSGILISCRRLDEKGRSIGWIWSRLRSIWYCQVVLLLLDCFCLWIIKIVVLWLFLAESGTCFQPGRDILTILTQRRLGRKTSRSRVFYSVQSQCIQLILYYFLHTHYNRTSHSSFHLY